MRPLLSASGAPYWMLCEVKPWREKGKPDNPSKYAEEGTAAHKLLEHYIQLHNGVNIEGTPVDEDSLEEKYPGIKRYVQETFDIVKNYPKQQLYSEQQLDISCVTGEDGAKGTADVVMISPGELTVLDLKYGKGVKVEAVDNMQLLIYGMAALEEFDVIGDIKMLHLMIHQPRLKHLVSWDLKVKEGSKRVKILKQQAQRILAAKGGDPHLSASPGWQQCLFCRAKADCREYAASKPTKIDATDFLPIEDDEYTESLLGLSKEK